MNMITKVISQSCTQLLLCLLGLGVLPLLIIYILLSLPIYLYRFIVCKVLAPICLKPTEKAVSLQGSSFAYELEGNSSKPRCAVIANVTFSGFMDFQFLTDLIQNNWLCGRNPLGGLAYPELQQHIESWMGYFFWRQDQNFNLADHLFKVVCEPGWSEEECEEYVCALTETLLNKPFPPGKSPWEIHLVHGYRNSNVSSSGDGIGPESETSMLIFRYHHCLADGFSFVATVLEGGLGIPLSQCDIATPSNVRKKLLQQINYNWIVSLVNWASLPYRLLLDIGNGILTKIKSDQMGWRKNNLGPCRQLYSRSEIIPIEKIKRIKAGLDAHFTAVVMSSVGAGLAKHLPSDTKTLPMGIPLPMKDHPRKLRNHVTGAILDISVDQSLNPLQRLRKSETLFQNAKKSTYPILTQVALKLFGSQVIPIARLFSTNGMVPGFLTNFPGPGVQLNALNRHTLLTVDFAVGLLSDVSGVGFMVISYFDHIRISATASSATMSKQELVEMIDDVVSEIDMLCELIPEPKFVKIGMESV